MLTINAQTVPIRGFNTNEPIKRNATTDRGAHPVQLELPFPDSSSFALNLPDSSSPTRDYPVWTECRNHVE